MAQSGNRPPRGGQPQKSGNRPPRNVRITADGTKGDSAAERARERLAQQNASGQKRQTASQRARSGGTAAQRSRAGGPASRRGSARNAPKRSTALTVGIFGTALVVLAVIVILVVSVTSPKTPNGKKPYGSRVAPAAIANAINHVSPAAFAAAGASNTSGVYVGSVKSLSGFPVLTACAVRHGRTGACLKRDGKPLIVYVGSEWCPYCAATRWPFAVALGRFGTFHGLHMTESSLSDVYAGTPSLSFYKTTYTSPYISFQGVEQCTDIPSTSKRPAIQDCNGYLPLETIPTQISKIFGKFDYPPYEPATPPIPGGIPFIDFGNQLHEDGAFMDPSILAGFTHLRVAESLGNPVASPAQSILVGANYYSAMICKLTNNKPASVCEMPVVKEAAAALKAAKI